MPGGAPGNPGGLNPGGILRCQLAFSHYRGEQQHTHLVGASLGAYRRGTLVASLVGDRAYLAGIPEEVEHMPLVERPLLVRLEESASVLCSGWAPQDSSPNISPLCDRSSARSYPARACFPNLPPIIPLACPTAPSLNFLAGVAILLLILLPSSRASLLPASALIPLVQTADTTLSPSSLVASQS
jgi:hypothetical protein